MENDQNDKPITIGALRIELQKQGENIKKDIRTEFREELGTARSEFKEGPQSLRKKFKNDLEKQEGRIKNHLDTVYEDFDSKQALMAENITAIKGNLNIVKEDVNVMKEDVEYIKLDINLIRQDLKTKVNRDELPQNLLARK